MCTLILAHCAPPAVVRTVKESLAVCFKGVSRKIEGCFKGTLRMFQGSSKGYFKGVEKMFQASFEMIEGLIFKVGTRKFRGDILPDMRKGVYSQTKFLYNIKILDCRLLFSYIL